MRCHNHFRLTSIAWLPFLSVNSQPAATADSIEPGSPRVGVQGRLGPEQSGSERPTVHATEQRQGRGHLVRHPLVGVGDEGPGRLRAAERVGAVWREVWDRAADAVARARA